MDVLSDPNHPGYLEMVGWRGAFSAEKFDSKNILFSDTLEDLKKLFLEQGFAFEE